MSINSREPRRPAAMRALSSLVSLPVIAATLALGGCDPGTSRPDLVPFPESRTVEVIQDRRAALESLRRALVADGFPIARVDTIDYWLDSPWFDARTLQPTGAGAIGAEVVKLRGWAEPSRPGHSILVVELVRRQRADPSVPPRELERPVAATDSLHARVGRVLKALQDELGADH